MAEQTSQILIFELFSLKSTTAILTGGTGGLGHYMTVDLAEAGAEIVSIQLPNSRNGPVLAEVVGELGRLLKVFECDVSDFAALRRTFAAIWAAGIVPRSY